MTRAIHVSLFALLAAAAGCGDGPAGPNHGGANAAQIARIAPRLGAMGFAVATGGQGRAFLDNFLPCVPRGAIHYVNAGQGRGVTFRGCDLGGGVVIAGRGALTWPGGPGARFCTPGPAAACQDNYLWNGELTVVLDGTDTVAIQTFTASGIQAAFPAPDSIALHAVTITLGGETVAMTDPNLLTTMFDGSAYALGRIANPGGSVDALTDADLARLAWHGGLAFFAVLFDETVSSSRGDHTDDLGCGTNVVTYDAERLPTINADWAACRASGLVVDGAFTMRWGRFETIGTLGVLRVDLSGTFTLGGAIPDLPLTALRWQIQGLNGVLPSDLTITVEVTGPGGSRSWTMTVPVDD